MNISSRGRTPRRLAFLLTLIVSGGAQIVLLVASTSLAGVPGQEQRPVSRDGASQISQTGADASFTRSRRIEPSFAQRYSPSAGGPIIRVALMTDVTSVTLTSLYGLIVRRAEKSSDDGKRIASGPLRIELRQQAGPSPSKAVAAYSVRVATSSEPRSARKLSDELKKNFFEPVTTIFNEKHKEYSVAIGRFAARVDAVRLAERLRAAGYKELRIVTDPAAITDSTSEANARAVKYKAQTSSATADRSGVRSDSHPIQLVATSADKLADSSEHELVVSPIHSPSEKDNESRGDSTARNQETGKPTKRREQTDQVVGVAATTASVRVAGKDYRGQIHLLLSPRGRINVVNSLPLEEYLRGVVPVELSPAVYPEIEALKAQAVAARSYALARLGQHSDEGFDLVDDTRAQVYGGLAAERELSNRAVDETRGLVAVYPNDDGRLVPIEALYTSNCGGRTENNEEVFGGTPRPYLRGVACAPDQQSAAGHEVVSKRALEMLTGIEGRLIARELGLLSVLGFSLPRRVTSQYLRSASDQDELKSWVEHISRVIKKEKPQFPQGSSTRLAEFIHLVAMSVYGEGRTSTLLAPADVDYLLAGLPVRDLPREARPDAAVLLRDGILQLPGGTLDWRATVTRAHAIEIVARAVSLRGQPKDLGSQVSNLKSQTSNSNTRMADSDSQILSSNPRIPEFKSGICAPAERGRLILAKTLKINGSDNSRQHNQPDGIEIADDAWLFRKLGEASYPVDRASLIGGELVTYHLNSRGQIDFLEASPSDRGAASDRFSSVALWQERVAVEDLQQRLAAARISVGRIDNIQPVRFSPSSRVTEVEITGDKNRVRIRRPQIRAALGVKEYLFVVDRETDANGRIVAFVFTGRGWGHGVGMCQIGAYGLAKEGYSYAAILQKYYTGTRLQKMY